MKKQSIIASLGLTIIAFAILLNGGGAVRSSSPNAEATESSELPADTPVLEFDKPVTEALNTDNPARLYTFSGKVDQLVSLSVKPQSGDVFTIVTILDSTLQNIIGGTSGEAVIGGSLIVKLPADGLYVVSVEYGNVTPETLPTGSYEVLLSEFKPAP
jgi:hypothetical protein